MNAREVAELEDRETSRDDLEARCAWNRERRMVAEKDAIALRARIAEMEAMVEKYLCRHKTHDPWCVQCLDRAALATKPGGDK